MTQLWRDYSPDGGTPESSEQRLTPALQAVVNMADSICNVVSMICATNQTVTRVSLGCRESNERNQSAPRTVEGAAEM